MARKRLRHRKNRILIWALAFMVGVAVYRQTGILIAVPAGWVVLRAAECIPWL